VLTEYRSPVTPRVTACRKQAPAQILFYLFGVRGAAGPGGVAIPAALLSRGATISAPPKSASATNSVAGRDRGRSSTSSFSPPMASSG
jgi:hypothetical protein